MALNLIRLALPWIAQPQDAIARLRQDLSPIGGVLPSLSISRDVFAGADYTVGSGLTRVATGNGIALDSTASNTGLTRTVSVSQHPFAFVFVGSVRGSGLNCLGSIASVGDRLVRVFGDNGMCMAQHLGATTNAAATTTGAQWLYGSPFVCVAVFAAPNEVRVYCRGVVGRASASNSTNVGVLGALSKLAFATYDGGSKVYPMDGRTVFAQWFRADFSDAFARQVLDDPWGQLFEPLHVMVPVPVAGAGGFNPAWARQRAQFIGMGVR